MADLTHIGDVIAEDWERQKCDALTLHDPTYANGVHPEGLWERLAEDDERDVDALMARIRAKRRPFIADWPALARWRDGVLREPRRHPTHVVAAALEAMALECTLAGYEELAQKARAQAEAIVLGMRKQRDLEGPYAT